MNLDLEASRVVTKGCMNDGTDEEELQESPHKERGFV